MMYTHAVRCKRNLRALLPSRQVGVSEGIHYEAPLCHTCSMEEPQLHMPPSVGTPKQQIHPPPFWKEAYEVKPYRIDLSKQLICAHG